jgi:poly(3-hydroxybutyrate) depolymerase
MFADAVRRHDVIKRSDRPLSLWERVRVLNSPRRFVVSIQSARRHLSAATALYLACILALASIATAPAAEPVPLGKSDFIFADDRGNTDKPIRVWLFRSENFKADSPIVFVMHGTLRNGETYREPCIPLAEPAGALVVVPEFSLEHYRDTTTYQFGNMRTKAGEPIEESKWTFAAIEHLFDHLKERTNSQRDNYFLFGHSAGAQFVHRMVLFQHNSRIGLAVIANAGSYTFPDFEIKFPYGLQGSPMSDSRLKAALQSPMLVLLGENDTDTNDKYLPKNTEAMAQGPMRLARGHNFYQAAESASQRLGFPLKWTKLVVSGVGHDNSRMAPVAARAMFEEK